ncbi:MAG: response regulator [Syntrophorhabdaceae bacterium]|nr:response regulator [Syntrophorhabdaceae bacterium]
MKILVIDDSALARRVLRGILSGAGHDVVEAEDGITGIEKYFLEKPEIVFLDLTMEGLKGVEVLKKIREMDKNSRIIVATADIQSATREEVIKEGAIGFVNKPFSEEKVISALKELGKWG